jgi:DNA-binding SARP family transcriptional activator
LLPIAAASEGEFDVQVSLDAATALVSMDAFDEAATVALADAMARSGRRVAARDLLIRYADQIRRDLDDDPPQSVVQAFDKVRTSQP